MREEWERRKRKGEDALKGEKSANGCKTQRGKKSIVTNAFLLHLLLSVSVLFLSLSLILLLSRSHFLSPCQRLQTENEWKEESDQIVCYEWEGGREFWKTVKERGSEEKVLREEQNAFHVLSLVTDHWQSYSSSLSLFLFWSITLITKERIHIFGMIFDGVRGKREKKENERGRREIERGKEAVHVSPSFDHCKLFCRKILISLLWFFRIAHLFHSLSILSIPLLLFTDKNFITTERSGCKLITFWKKKKIPRRTLILLQREGFAMNTFLGFNFLAADPIMFHLEEGGNSFLKEREYFLEERERE